MHWCINSGLVVVIVHIKKSTNYKTGNEEIKNLGSASIERDTCYNNTYSVSM